MPALGAGAEFFIVPPSALSEEDIASILSVLPQIKFPEILRHFVIELGRGYRYQRLAAEPPRSETRFQLRLMAHLAWRAEQAQPHTFPIRQELAKLISSSNREAKRLLLENIRTITGDTDSPGYVHFYQDWLDFKLIGDAAVCSQSRMNGKGDYANVALGNTVQIMAFVVEFCTGERPTFSRVGIGEGNSDGTLRTIAGSIFGRFMLSFFSKVDPDLPQTQVTSAVERGLADIRRQAKVDPYYYRSLSNLL